MKVGSYTPNNGKIEGVKIFRPAQSILLNINFPFTPGSTASDTRCSLLKDMLAKINVTLQNSDTGNLTTLIPYLKLTNLAEISTFNEGAVVINNNNMIIPIMLNPLGNIDIDNDKFLQLDIIDVDDFISSIDIHSFELGVESNFIAKYSKMNVPAGSSRYAVNCAGNDLILLPRTGYDEVQITYKSGVVSSFSSVELQYYMAKNNDLSAYGYDDSGNGVAARVRSLAGGGVPTEVLVDLYMSILSSYVLNLIDVDKIELIRESDSSNSLEFILGDFVEDKEIEEKSKK